MASFLLAPLPYLSIGGGIVGIIGGIYLAMGIRVRGSHQYNLAAALALFVLGTIFAIPDAISFPLISTNEGLLSAFEVDIFLFLASAIVAAALTGASIVLFTYELQDSGGRLLLLAGYGAMVATSVLTLVLGIYQYDAILNRACNAECHPPSTNALSDLQSYIQLLRALGFIPATVYFVSYFRLGSKMRRNSALTALKAPLSLQKMSEPST